MTINKIVIVVSIVLAIILSNRCANPSVPTGGEKDTIPPTLIHSIPEIGKLNFNKKEITLIFDELITTNNINQNLIVTPKIDTKFKTLIRKNKVILKFEDEFPDSTTISINFFETITDITEKNSAKNLTLAFSTTSYIDSLEIKGNIESLLKKEKKKNFLVGLYLFSDTLNLLKDYPKYFTTTNDSGFFKLSYLKEDLYKILAFDDKNKNLLLESKSEEHAFKSNIINPSMDTAHIALKSVLQDISPLKLVSSRAIRNYYEFKFNKLINKYQIIPDSFSSMIKEKNNSIRIYPNEKTKKNDSIDFIITAADSLKNNYQDTTKILFMDYQRKKEEFTTIFYKKTGIIQSKNKIVTNFNKPILSSYLSKYYFLLDSTTKHEVEPKIKWKEHNHDCDIIIDVNADSLYTVYNKLFEVDTSVTDSIQILKNKYKHEFPILIIDKGAFVSVEKDTTEKEIIGFIKERKKSYGELKINITTDYKNFTTQLINRNEEVSYEIKNKKIIYIKQIISATYSIRILIDNNMDGKWSHGNLLANEEPEDVYLHEEKTKIPENWLIEIDIAF